MSRPTFRSKRKGKKVDPYPLGAKEKSKSTNTKRSSKGRPKSAKVLCPHCGKYHGAGTKKLEKHTKRAGRGRPRALLVAHKEFPHEDPNRPPTRRPSSMGKHAYKRLLRKWKPSWSKVSLDEFAPQIQMIVEEDFGEGRELELWTLDEKSWNLYYKRVKNKPEVIAEAGDWYLKINPEYLDALAGGNTYNETGYKAHVVSTHEVLHTRSKKYSDLNPPLEEGLTEYHAHRIVSENLGAPKKTRGYMKKDLPIIYSSYPNEVQAVQRIALRVSGGDKERARAWLEKVYLVPGRSRFFREEMESAGMDKRDIDALTTAKSGYDTKFQNASSRIRGEVKSNLLKPRAPLVRKRRKKKNV